MNVSVIYVLMFYFQSSNHGPSYSPALPTLLPQRPRPTTALLTALLSPPFFPRDLIQPRPFLQLCSPHPSFPETSSNRGPSYSPALPTLLPQRPCPTTALLTALLSPPFFPRDLVPPQPFLQLCSPHPSSPETASNHSPSYSPALHIFSSPETTSNHGPSYSPVFPTFYSPETSSHHGPSYSPALPALLPQRPRPTTALLTALLSPSFFPRHLVPPRPFLQPCSPRPSSPETSSHHGPSYSPAFPVLLPQRPCPTTALLTALLSQPFFPRDLVQPRPFLQLCSPHPSFPETSSRHSPSYSSALPTLLPQRPRPTTALLTALLSTSFLPQRPHPTTALLTALFSPPFLPQRPRPTTALLTALLSPPFFRRDLVPPQPFLPSYSPPPPIFIHYFVYL